MQYDLIIIGSGSVGSAAGYYAAKAGTKVLMIDSGVPPHKNASHHGVTRIFRCAYGEGAQYVPLVLRAKQLWKELGELSGKEVMKECGVLNLAPKDSRFMANIQKSVEQFKLKAEILSPKKVHERWAGITAPEDYAAVFEPDSGVLNTELAIGAYVKLSKEAGAEQLFNTVVTAVKPIENGVEVETSAGKFRSRKALVSAGTWVRKLFPEMPIQPLRKIFVWHNAPECYKNIPGFVILHKSHSYYGFPSDGIGLKVGKHNGGQLMQSLDEYLPYGAIAEDKTELLECMGEFLRGAGEAVHGEVCSYDMSPDEDFIIDIVPNIPNAMVVSGLSGHGFKFTSALGEVAALFGGGKESPIDLSSFRLNRFKKRGQL